MVRSSLRSSARLALLLPAAFLASSFLIGCGETVEQAKTESGKSVDDSLVKSKTKAPAKAKHDVGPAARKGGEG